MHQFRLICYFFIHQYACVGSQFHCVSLLLVNLLPKGVYIRFLFDQQSYAEEQSNVVRDEKQMSSCKFRYPCNFNPMFNSSKHVRLNFGGLSASFVLMLQTLQFLGSCLPSMMKKLHLLQIYLFSILDVGWITQQFVWRLKGWLCPSSIYWVPLNFEREILVVLCKCFCPLTDLSNCFNDRQILLMRVLIHVLDQQDYNFEMSFP